MKRSVSLIKHLRIVTVVVLLFAILGCAEYSIKKGGTGDGYDVYRPEPYLLIPPQGAKDASAPKIIWLPNYNERYRITTWNVLAKADFTFNFADGWQLTSISDKSDNTTIAKGLVDILSKSVKEGAVALSGNTQLYKIIFGSDGSAVGLKFVPFVP